VRAKIAQAIDSNPGIHLRGLERKLDCSTTTLEYHLEFLPVKQREIRNYRRIYPDYIPERLELPLANLNHDKRGPMIYYIGEGRGLGELPGLLDVSRSTVSSHLKVLEEDGIVSTEKDGRKKSIELSSDAVKAVKSYASEVLDTRVENFIDMWE